MNEGKTKAAQKQQTISFVMMSVSHKKLPTVPHTTTGVILIAVS
jgi:hypothetical protein